MDIIKMKRFTLCLLLLTLIACAHKPIVGPEEVNDYLDGPCHICGGVGYSMAFEGVSRVEMHEKLAEALGE